MPQHLPQPHHHDDTPERAVYARLDPAHDRTDSPLRRVLRAARMRGPFNLGRRPRPDDQEN